MADFDYDKFTKKERERYLMRERNEVVERHRENDFFGSAPFKPRGFYHSVRFALLILPLWILFIWWTAFLVGYPFLNLPASREFNIQWIYWIFMSFLGMSGLVVFIYSYKFWRKGKLKLFQMLFGIFSSAVLSPIVAAIIAFLISNS